METITSLAPEDYVVAAGAAFLAYLLVPPVWSLVTFSLRGYKGNVAARCVALLAFINAAIVFALLTVSLDAASCCSGDLTPAQALDKVTTQGYVLIDVRTDKDKAKAGVPEMPSNAKNKLISVPYAPISFPGHELTQNAEEHSLSLHCKLQCEQ